MTCFGTLAKWGQAQGLEVTILTGDRDSFQLIDNNIKVRIPRTVQGKTETEDYTTETVLEKYGLPPQKLIEVKGLAGDSSDNIPGVTGVGEKTAINLIKEYGDIEHIYENIENIKGKLKEKLEQDKDIAFLSRTLGTIDINAPIDKNLEDMEVVDWNKEQVEILFTRLKLNRFMERFNLTKQVSKNEEAELKVEFEEITNEILRELIEEVNITKRLYYYLVYDTENGVGIINRRITGIMIYSEKKEKVYNIQNVEDVAELLEDADILKIGYKQKEDYILLKQNNINVRNLMFDVEIAGYLLNCNINKYTIEYLAEEYLKIDVTKYIEDNGLEQKQLSMFETTTVENKEDNRKNYIYAYIIYKLYNVLTDKMTETETIDLFRNIEMPLVEVLANMQYEGIFVDKNQLIEIGNELKLRIEELTKEIYELAEEEFNINSTKQLGEILFEKLKLPLAKKNKTGYSTGVDILEKLKYTHPIIEKLLEYRQLVKLNSTYVEGLIPYINNKTGRIHSYFHQTVTATGRISSTEPNLQNIPTRYELGKNLRKVFIPGDNRIFIDADYSQIELRVLAHLSNDEHMVEAFKNNEDIHKQVASKVFGIPMDEVTKEQRSRAKAVNFGIVYGITDFGLGEQIGISRKEAKQYIDQYLEKYSGIKNFMDNIIEKAKQDGYVETLYHRRRYVPELKSNNYMVRQFGNRIAMNTPIQGTAADIMKLAMIKVFNKLKEENLQSKIILQVHDELLIEAAIGEEEKVKAILKQEMEDVINLKVPLKIDIEEGNNLYDAK